MPELLFLLFPVFLGLICLLAWYGYLQEKKRREAMAELVLRRGWRFEPRQDATWDSRYPQFSCFTTGHSRYAYNLLHGTMDACGQTWPLTAGDYTYQVTSGTGKDRKTTTYHFSFLLFHLPYEGLPQLTIRPEGFFDRVSAIMGFDDIDFESEEFSRKFHVQSSDKRFAYDLLHPRMMEFMLASPPDAFEIDGDVYCVRSTSNRWEPVEIEQQVDWCQRWLERWPPHLLADLQSSSTR